MTTHRSHRSTGRSLRTRIVPMSTLALAILVASSDPAAAAREHKSRGGNSDKATVTRSRDEKREGKGDAKAAREVQRADGRRSQSPQANDEKRVEVRREEKPAAQTRASERKVSRSSASAQRAERVPTKSDNRNSVEPPSRTVERREQIQRDGRGSQDKGSRDRSDRSWERSYDRRDHDDRSYDSKRHKGHYDREKYDAGWRSREVVHRQHPRKVKHVQKWYSNAQTRWSADIHVVGRPAYYCYRPVRHVPTRVVYWHERPYYDYVSLGVYFPRFWIDFAITDAAPYGYTFYDPYCDDFFPTVSAYREHLYFCGGHHPALDIVCIDDIDYDPVYCQRVSSPWWHVEIGGYFN